MKDLLEKIGLYDIVVLFLTGAIILTISLIVYENIFILSLNLNIQIFDETIAFFVGSYFVGLIFQELSSFLHRKIFSKNKKILFSVFKEMEEMNYIIKYFEDNFNILANKELFIYNFCKSKVEAVGKSPNIVKFQTISDMSRSLYLYLFILAIFMLGIAIANFHIHYLVAFVITIILCIVIFIRYIRFEKLRISQIFKVFYYDIILNTN